MGKKPKVAIVLGQGGLKPAAALPIFEMIEEEGIECDLIVGCSGGSLVGGLKAAKKKPEEIHDILSYMAKNQYLHHANSKQLLGLMKVPFFNYNKEEGFVKTNLMVENLNQVFKNLTFDQLPIQLIVGGTDFETGESITISSGLVKDALSASSSIYPFMPPVKIDGRLVVDGALSVPIPFGAAAKMNPDLIIALKFNFFPNYSPEGFFSCCDNFFSQAIEKKGMSLLQESVRSFPGRSVIVDICLDKQISVLETDGLEAIVEEGRRFAKSYRDRILKEYELTVESV